MKATARWRAFSWRGWPLACNAAVAAPGERGTGVPVSLPERALSYKKLILPYSYGDVRAEVILSLALVYAAGEAGSTGGIGAARNLLRMPTIIEIQAFPLEPNDGDYALRLAFAVAAPGWRLPTVRELQTLVDPARMADPASTWPRSPMPFSCLLVSLAGVHRRRRRRCPDDHQLRLPSRPRAPLSDRDRRFSDCSGPQVYRGKVARFLTIVNDCGPAGKLVASYKCLFFGRVFGLL